MKNLTLNGQEITLKDLEAFLNDDINLDDERLNTIIQDDGFLSLEEDHMSKYICTAILMKAYMMGRSDLRNQLSKGLNASCAMADEDIECQIKALNAFKKAGIREFIDIYPNICPEFTDVIRKIVSKFFYDDNDTLDSTYEFDESDAEDILDSIYDSLDEINEYFSKRNVFTYGTLMKGEANHGYLDDSEFIAKTTLQGYDMYNVGWYPAIVKGDGMLIGELYQVPIDDMPSIDYLEGEGDLYEKRCEVVKVNGESVFAFVYVYLRDVYGLDRIASWKDHVWYVSYGSNMLFERFRCYIEGGSYKGSREKEACDDTTLPVAVKTVLIPYDMYFGNYSESWDYGGVSFLDTSKEGKAIGVAYLITEHQLEHVARWENNGRDLCDDCGWYEHIISLGTMDGFELKTVTNVYMREFNEPSEDYLDTLRDGIVQNWPDMSEEEIWDYLMGCIR